MVALTWWSAVSVHAAINLQGERLELLPGLVRWWFAVLPDAWGATPMLVLVVAVVLAVDGHRLRRGGGWLFPLPVHGPFVRVDDALGRLVAPASAPAVVRRLADVAADVVRSWWFVLADTVRALTTFVAAGARQPGEPWWHAARAAQASTVMTRRTRELILAETAPPSRPLISRSAAAGIVIALLVAAFPISRALAEHVETTRDRSLGITWWLAGLLDRLGAWWGDLSGWEKALVIGAAFAFTAAITLAVVPFTTGGMLMAGASGATALHSVAANSDSLADMVRDPHTAARNYWKNATPASVLLDAGTLALTFWAPSRMATPVRTRIDHFARGRPGVTPAMLGPRADDLSDSPGGPLSLGERPGFAPDGGIDFAAFRTHRDTAYFWSGRVDGAGVQVSARSHAAASRGTTLEQLMERRGIELPEWDPDDPAVMEMWSKASEAYADGAQGRVRVVLGDDLRPGNVWETAELPRLIDNGSVTSIVRINPRTGVEERIWP